jgi:alcohol dehydrogenase
MATGVCRSDWHGWKGHDDDIKHHGLPFVPGHEFSGVVVEIGKSVQRISVGDRVAVPFILSCGKCAECKVEKPTVCLNQSQPGFTMLGSFAEFVEVTRADRNLTILPEGVSFVEAAALGCRFTTAYRAVVQQGGLFLGKELLPNMAEKDQGRTTAVANSLMQQHGKENGKIVCVFGCGGLGLSCIMIAKALNANGVVGKQRIIRAIIAVDVSFGALEKAIELGADHVINVRELGMKDEAVQQRVLELTNGLGADITIDAAGFPSTCENAIYTCRRGGRMVQVGLPIGEKRPLIPMGMVAAREIEIVGSHGFNASDLPHLLHLVDTGKLPVKKLIEKETSLEEGAKILMNMDKESPLGMTVITRFNESSRGAVTSKL